MVKNDDGRGDESNYPFTLHIDYQKDAFYLDYGYDDADARQLQKPISRPVRWLRKAFSPCSMKKRVKSSATASTASTCTTDGRCRNPTRAALRRTGFYRLNRTFCNFSPAGSRPDGSCAI
ncbi:hypothetical protein IC615_18835 [Serratia ureilytica]